MDLSALVGKPSRRGKLQIKTSFIPSPSHHHRVIIILSLSWSHKSSLSSSFYNHHIFLSSHRHESENAREATDKYRRNYKPSIDMRTKILCIFVFFSGCCLIALLHSCFPCVWLFVTFCALLLSCLVYVTLLFLCFAVSSWISHLNVLYMFFIVFHSFFFGYRIFHDHTSREFVSGSVN